MNRMLIIIMFMMSSISVHALSYFGKALCNYPQYTCVKVNGQSWEKLFPDPAQRDLVQRLNRTYNYLWTGKEIVVPVNLVKTTIADISPFPLHREATGGKEILIDQEKLAWGAYDATGKLVTWGPISSGRDKCSDSNNSCRTQAGSYRIFSKEGNKCRSGVFPIGKGGAKMPYCMYFHKGFALHGADDMPGIRASHGCIRMFVKDAKWLNEHFVELSSERNNFMGTRVVVLPLPNAKKNIAYTPKYTGATE